MFNTVTHGAVLAYHWLGLLLAAKEKPIIRWAVGIVAHEATMIVLLPGNAGLLDFTRGLE